MRLSAHVQFTLKDKPRGFLGQTGESLCIGRDKFLPFDAMAGAFIRRALEWYLRVSTADELNAALDRLRAALVPLRVDEIMEAPE